MFTYFDILLLLSQLSLQPSSTSQLSTNIKEESSCSTAAPCQFSLKPVSLQKHCPVSSAAPATTAPVVTMDKDKMLQQKDKQIEELTRMLRQKQRLVDVLRMQLEQGKRGGQVAEPVVLVRVKQEPPDKPGLPSSPSCEMDVTKVTVKQEAIDAEEVVSETTVRSPDTHGLLRSQTQEQIQLQIKPGQTSAQTKQDAHVRLQQTTLQLAQQQAIQKLLLQQQRNIQNGNRMLDNQQNLQRLSQQRKKKSYKQQLKQQQQQSQQSQSQQQHQQQSKQHQQQMQLKQQILLKQQKSLLQQQIKQQQQTKQPQQIQIQTKIHLKQQQLLIQQKQKAQKQSLQVRSYSNAMLSWARDAVKITDITACCSNNRCSKSIQNFLAQFCCACMTICRKILSLKVFFFFFFICTGVSSTHQPAVRLRSLLHSGSHQE